LKAELYYDAPDGTKEPLLSSQGDAMVFTLNLKALSRGQQKKKTLKQREATAPCQVSFRLGQQQVDISFRNEGDL